MRPNGGGLRLLRRRPLLGPCSTDFQAVLAATGPWSKTFEDGCTSAPYVTRLYVSQTVQKDVVQHGGCRCKLGNTPVVQERLALEARITAIVRSSIKAGPR